MVTDDLTLWRILRGNAPKLDPSAFQATDIPCMDDMRPLLTCTDELVFWTDFQMGDIARDDVISFVPPMECGLPHTPFVSRVTSRRTSGNAIQLRVQGDNKTEAYNCSVPWENVTGILVEVRKGVRPGNVMDTSAYEDALQEYDALANQYDALVIQHNGLEQQYAGLVRDYRAGQVTLAALNRTLGELVAADDSLSSVAHELGDASSRLQQMECDLFDICPQAS